MLRELCWIGYTSGFRVDVIEKYWPSISKAFADFDPEEVATMAKKLQYNVGRVCRESGFRNASKARWCIVNAMRIMQFDHEKRRSGGLKGYLVKLSEKDLRCLTSSYKDIATTLDFMGIGESTIFHFMKNMGINIFKPDRHVRRLLYKFGLTDNEFSPVQDMCTPMLWLSSSTGISVSELDTFLFIFGAITADAISPLQNVLRMNNAEHMPL